MDKYTTDQLFDILRARARRGLAEAVITDEQLSRIAAAGDARLAIGMLRIAASTADRENCDRITEEILRAAASDAQAQLRQKSLDSLTPHQETVFEIVREHGPLSPSEIHTHYTMAVGAPEETNRADVSFENGSLQLA